MKCSIQIQTLSWAEASQLLLKVRTAVFVVEQGVPASIEVDEHDENSNHFLATTEDGVPVGTARLLPSGKIGRVAVLRSLRRQGIGFSLMKAAILHWQDCLKKKTPLLLHAQVSSIPFYESLGFSAQGTEFDEAGIAHRKMVLSFSQESDGTEE